MPVLSSTRTSRTAHRVLRRHLLWTSNSARTVAAATERQLRTAALAFENLIVQGPSSSIALPAWQDTSGEFTADRALMRPNAPVPNALQPVTVQSESLEAIGTPLRVIAGSLAWYWLADSAVVDNGVVSVRVEGSRPNRRGVT